MHSLRSGGESATAAVGIPERLIARQGGWRSSSTVRRYIQEPFKTLKASKACSS